MQVAPSPPPAQPAPSSQPSLSILDGCAFDDLHCYKVKWVLSDLKLAIANNDLASAKRNIVLLTADLAATKSLINSAVAGIQSAASTTNQLAGDIGIPWYFHPALWVTVGLVVATVVVVGFEKAFGVIH